MNGASENPKSGPESNQNATGKRPIGQSALEGVFWMGGGQVIKQIIATATSIALARILAPGDFGVFAMVYFAMEIAQIFADFGFGAAIVQRRVDDSRTLSTCFWLNMCVAGAVSFIFAAAGPLLADFFSQPVLTWLAIGCAVNIVLTCSIVIPQALLSQRFDFRVQARAQIAGSAVGAAAAVGFAIGGAGVWSLLFQPLVGTSVSLVLLFIASRWRPSFEFDYTRVRDMISFGAHLLAGSVVQSFGKSFHNVILGKSLGPAPLGFYNMAHNVSYVPIYQISAVVVKVLFPTLVDLNGDPERQQAAYKKVIGAIALITFPCLGGLFAVADDFVLVVFGEKWLDMVPVLKIICWVLMLQSVATTASTILLSSGQAKTLFHLSVAYAIMLTVGLLIGSQWGLLGTAWGWALAATAYFLLLTFVAGKKICLSLSGFARAVLRPLIATLAMVAILAGAGLLVEILSSMLRLAALIALGTISYVLLTLALNRQDTLAIASLIKSTLFGRK